MNVSNRKYWSDPDPTDLDGRFVEDPVDLFEADLRVVTLTSNKISPRSLHGLSNAIIYTVHICFWCISIQIYDIYIRRIVIPTVLNIVILNEKSLLHLLMIMMTV